MAKIKVDTDALQSESAKLQTQIQQYEAINLRLENVLIKIDNSWDGNASEAYIVLMKRYANRSRKMVSVLKEYKKYVDTARTRFEEKDKEMNARIRSSF